MKFETKMLLSFSCVSNSFESLWHISTSFEFSTVKFKKLKGVNFFQMQLTSGVVCTSSAEWLFKSSCS